MDFCLEFVRIQSSSICLTTFLPPEERNNIYIYKYTPNWSDFCFFLFFEDYVSFYSLYSFAFLYVRLSYKIPISVEVWKHSRHMNNLAKHCIWMLTVLICCVLTETAVVCEKSQEAITFIRRPSTRWAGAPRSNVGCGVVNIVGSYRTSCRQTEPGFD